MLPPESKGLPVSVQVGPMTYHVVVHEEMADEPGGPIFGRVCFDNLTLEVNDVALGNVRPTVLHELIHIILEQAGHRKHSRNENLINALVYGLLGVQLGSRPLIDTWWGS